MVKNKFSFNDKNMRALVISGIIVISSFSSSIIAQSVNDTIQTEKEKKKEKPVYLKPYHRNVIKFNPTPMVLLDVSNITISYERLLKKNNSVALQAGYLVFPNLVQDTLIGLIEFKDRSRSGINLSFDYRNYIFDRNTRPAPDGMYLGGYLSYYGFQFENKFDILHVDIDKEGTMDGKMNFINLGMELGYQFVFWKRMTVDLLLFGPSLSLYNGTFNISGNLDADEIADIEEELVDKLQERFPYLGMIFSTEDLQFTGEKTEFDIGFRYSISVGFHF
jgi:hypothetical protein